MVLSLNILVNCLRRTGTACRRAYSGTRTTVPQQYKSKAPAINAVAKPAFRYFGFKWLQPDE